MNKLTKGIKKKVKGKKKPTQEELEQEELRQYRLEKQREKEERDRKEAERTAEGDSKEEEESERTVREALEEKPAAESAEWARFRELTSGVDSVLSSTKESLHTIKETSYFIRKKTASEQKAEDQLREHSAANASGNATAVSTNKPKWVDVDAEEEESPNPEPEPEKPVSPVESPKSSTTEKPEPVDVLSEVEKLERAQYFEEDVFNTEYVDAVTSGDIGLAVIPDSPTEEGEDPFDTSAVDQVLHIKPEDPKKNKLKAITLGNAVEVLRGGQHLLYQTEDEPNPTDSCLKKSKRRQRGVYRRPGSLDLLNTEEAKEDGEESKPKDECQATSAVEQLQQRTLLDEDLEGNDEFELNLAVTPEQWKLQAQPETNQSDENENQGSNNHLSDIVSEFEHNIGHTQDGSNQAILCAKPPDEEDNEFDSLATESLLRAKDREEIIGEDDPFDTSAAQSVLGKDTTHNEDDQAVKFDADFGEGKTSHPQRPPPPVIVTSPEKEQPDFLTSNEHHDYEHLPDPITLSRSDTERKSPTNTGDQPEEADPFDTSAADQLCGTEIKLLESELLGPTDPSVTVELVSKFDDFDPRAEEQKPEIDPFDTSFAGGFILQPSPNVEELLESSPTHDTTPVVLPPTKGSNSFVTEQEIDPFDTSIADAYSNVEIKVLERELRSTLNPIVSTDLSEKIDLSAISAPPPRPPRPVKFAASFGEEEEEVSVKLPTPPAQPELLVLTPTDEVAPVSLLPQKVGDASETEESDPFDTSIANKFGSVEVGVLEKELLEEAPTIVAKQLTYFLPTISSGSGFETCVTEAKSKPAVSSPTAGKELDPFDTGYVDTLCITGTSQTDGARLSKPNTLQVSESSAALLAATPEDPNPPLQPFAVSVDATEEIDPFDTSVADQFGHTELRVLENELIGEVKCSALPTPPPPPSHRTPATPAPPKNLQPSAPSVDQLLVASPSTDLPPTLLPSFGGDQCLRELSPILLDPFDTSIADTYSATELKVIEQEFVSGDQESRKSPLLLKRSVSDPDFDPRGDEKIPRPASPPAQGQCLLSLDNAPAFDKVQALTATVVAPLQTTEPEEVDPFDTSFADSLLPGQAELQAIERELLHS